MDTIDILFFIIAFIVLVLLFLKNSPCEEYRALRVPWEKTYDGKIIKFK